MRSYQGYYTRSHQNSEVKRLWAGIVLGWVTSREVPVLHPFSKNLENIFPLNCFSQKNIVSKKNLIPEKNPRNKFKASKESNGKIQCKEKVPPIFIIGSGSLHDKKNGEGVEPGGSGTGRE